MDSVSIRREGNRYLEPIRMIPEYLRPALLDFDIVSVWVGQRSPSVPRLNSLDKREREEFRTHQPTRRARRALPYLLSSVV